MARQDWNIAKKNREKAQLEVFQESFIEIQEAVIHQVQNDPPDSYFLLNDKKISIELTEIIWDKDKDGVNKKEQESLANQIVQIAERKYEKLGLPPLYTSISFIDQYGLLKWGDVTILTPTDKEKLSDYIVQKVIEFTPHQMDELIEVPLWNESGDRLMDEKIDSLYISKHEYLDSNCWTTSGGECIPDITYEKLDSIIQKKNIALLKYKNNFNESWLVIVEYWDDISGYFGFRFIDEFLEKSFKSQFDRVFILRSRRREIIELKTAE